LFDAGSQPATSKQSMEGKGGVCHLRPARRDNNPREPQPQLTFHL